MEKEDSIARRVRLRREEAERQAALSRGESGPIQAHEAAPQKALNSLQTAPDELPVMANTEIQALKSLPPEFAVLQNSIETGENPVSIARHIFACIQAGMNNKQIAQALQVQPPWVSKKLSLLQAAPEVMQLIENGSISETEFYNNRQHVEKQIKGNPNLSKYQRMPTVTVGIEAANSLVKILQILAKENSLTPIMIGKTLTKKEITAILNLRAGEVAQAIKK